MDKITLILIICIVALAIFLIGCAIKTADQKENFEDREEYIDGKHYAIPKNGFVPDEETAIRIAEAVWIPIYGKEQIEGEKPFKATLENGVWTVTGSLPEGYKGGVAVIEISKNDGKILRVSHGK